VNCLDWLDDNVFASGGNDHKIFVHRIDDQRYHYVFEGHNEEVILVKWSPPHLHPLPSSNQRYLASVADDGQLMIWQMPIYPLARYKSSSVGSASPLKREDRDSTVGDDYQFEAAAKHLVCKWQVVDEGTDQRLLALDWCKDKLEGKMLLAA
jgi:transducin (beta)-like 1